jgi:hypothetical protein
MTAALATLTSHNVARGSTLLNITQQVAASIGTALFSVILTNENNEHPEIQQAQDAAQAAREAGQPMPDPDDLEGSARAAYEAVTALLADSFATVFIVATVLVACCLIPAAFLPRKKVAPVDPTAMMVH